MDKSPEAFRTISEVAEELDLPQHVLRFWETRFSQIKPLKRGGGRRLYRPDHIALLRGIKALLYDDGLTIKGAQKVIRERGQRAVMARGRGDAMLGVESRVPEDATERLAAIKARQDGGAKRGPRVGGDGPTAEKRRPGTVADPAQPTLDLGDTAPVDGPPPALPDAPAPSPVAGDSPSMAAEETRRRARPADGRGRGARERQAADPAKAQIGRHIARLEAILARLEAG
ncbi:MAG: MerR family transcriptional regulator [Pseudomonadota bacterium]